MSLATAFLVIGITITLASCPLVAALSSPATAAPVLTDRAPSWNSLLCDILATETGMRLQNEAEQRRLGLGPPHTDALLRRFHDGVAEKDVRVTLYRDAAAWCQYCQRCWIFLEEKRIPYRVERVPLNAYGDKPAWYTRRVDGGKLPALELDGKLYRESMEIIKLLDASFPNHGRQMVPSAGTREAELAEELLRLEQELQSAWFSLVFYPVTGDDLDQARSGLLVTLGRVNDALSATPGPWFLGDDAPSHVDIQYITTVERLVASALYWKGLTIRGLFEHVDAWLEAFEARPAYLATKSDYYTLVMAMPSQNGPGYAAKEAKDVANIIYGLDSAWELPCVVDLEEAFRGGSADEKAARHEAAFCLASNHEQVVRFACRGAGEPGRPSFHAELADPYSVPNEEFFAAVDVCLRHVAFALLKGTNAAKTKAIEDLANKGGSGELRNGWEAYHQEADGRTYYWNYETGDVTWTPPTQQLDSCLAYLRDRIGVPRDMGHAAAMQLRAHLNWAIALLQ